MILHSRIAVIGMLLLSVLTTSCGTGRRQADEIKDAVAEVMSGLRDGLYDSTVVVTINDTVASAADAEMVASTISMTTSSGATRGGGLTTINIVLPDSYGDDIDDDVPSFVAPVAMLGTVMVFGMPVLAIFLICYFIYRTKRARYQAVSQIVASGQDVPPGMFPQVDPRSKWSSGIKYLAWGVALMLFFLARFQLEWAMLMLVPVIIGAGKLLAYRREQQQGPVASSDDVHDCGDSDNTPHIGNTPNFPPIPPRR